MQYTFMFLGKISARQGFWFEVGEGGVFTDKDKLTFEPGKLIICIFFVITHPRIYFNCGLIKCRWSYGMDWKLHTIFV